MWKIKIVWKVMKVMKIIKIKKVMKVIRIKDVVHDNLIICFKIKIKIITMVF